MCTYVLVKQVNGDLQRAALVIQTLGEEEEPVSEARVPVIWDLDVATEDGVPQPKVLEA